MNLSERLQRFLETTEANLLDVCVILYNDFLSKSDNPEKILKTIFEHHMDIGNLEAENLGAISNDDVSNFMSSYYNLIDAIVKNLIDQNLDVLEFYKKLYANVFESPLFPKEENAPVIILFILLTQKSLGIPYHQAENLLIMNEDQYKKIINNIEEEIGLAVYMLNRHFKSKTEETSQLYNIASKLKSKEEQIVFWSSIISIIKHFSGVQSADDNIE